MEKNCQWCSWKVCCSWAYLPRLLPCLLWMQLDSVRVQRVFWGPGRPGPVWKLKIAVWLKYFRKAGVCQLPPSYCWRHSRAQFFAPQQYTAHAVNPYYPLALGSWKSSLIEFCGILRLDAIQQTSSRSQQSTVGSAKRFLNVSAASSGTLRNGS